MKAVYHKQIVVYKILSLHNDPFMLVNNYFIIFRSYKTCCRYRWNWWSSAPHYTTRYARWFNLGRSYWGRRCRNDSIKFNLFWHNLIALILMQEKCNPILTPHIQGNNTWIHLILNSSCLRCLLSLQFYNS